jgi:DHA2 family multidrug resistance protein
MSAIPNQAVLDSSADAHSSRFNAWMGFMALVVGNFMAVLDVQIVGSSINELQAGLSASADEIHWIQTSYLIAEVIAIPLYACLARLLSTRVYFTVAALGFSLASAACALSWSLGSMVLFRVLQGLVGGGMVPTLFAVLYILFPENQRAAPTSIAGITSLLAPALGPSIGGYVTETTSWHWLFLMNIPPGLLAAYMAWRWLRLDRPEPGMLSRIDVRGAIYMALFLGCFEYALDEGPRLDWFADDSVAACTLVSAVSAYLFFSRTLRVAHPIVELREFRDRNFAAGSTVVGVVGMSIYSLMYLMPLFLGEVRGYSPRQIGGIMMVQGFAMAFSAPLCVKLSELFDQRIQIVIGLVAIAAGCWCTSFMTPDWGAAQFVLPQVLRGFGNVACFVCLTNVTLGTLPPAEIANASGLYNVLRNIGGAIGLASISTLMNQRVWLHWQQLAETTHPGRTIFAHSVQQLGTQLHAQLGNSGNAAALGIIAGQAQLQVSTMAFNDMNWLLTMSLLATVPLVFLLRKPGARNPNAGAVH